MKGMKITRKLNNNISFEEVKSIYARGNKIAIAFANKVTFSYLNTIIDAYPEIRGHENEISYIQGVQLNSNDDGIAFIEKGNLVTIDSILSDRAGCLGVIKPFEGNWSGCKTTFCLYDDRTNTIADVVVEVLYSR